VLRTLSGAKSNCMQNYQSTMEIPKLTIDTVVTETKRVAKDINLPYFFKDKSGGRCKVVTLDHFISVDNDKNWWAVRTRPVKGYEADIAKGETITEDEFEAAYSNALMCVQLIKESQEPSRERDPNEEIDEMRERLAS
jgi:hypothetical protein